MSNAQQEDFSKKIADNVNYINKLILFVPTIVSKFTEQAHSDIIVGIFCVMLISEYLSAKLANYSMMIEAAVSGHEIDKKPLGMCKTLWLFCSGKLAYRLAVARARDEIDEQKLQEIISFKDSAEYLVFICGVLTCLCFLLQIALLLYPDLLSDLTSIKEYLKGKI